MTISKTCKAAQITIRLDQSIWWFRRVD